MLVQPFIENAIKHGLLHKEGKKELFIQFEKQRHKLTCTIIDNGIGRKKAAEIKARQKQGHRSFSVSATQNRIEIMQNQYNQTIGIQYTDLTEGETATGTQVVISMPFREF
jgi:sensor histidine kinase YesM